MNIIIFSYIDTKESNWGEKHNQNLIATKVNILSSFSVLVENKAYIFHTFVFFLSTFSFEEANYVKYISNNQTKNQGVAQNMEMVSFLLRLSTKLYYTAF
jgi:hypothetical protein